MRRRESYITKAAFGLLLLLTYSSISAQDAVNYVRTHEYRVPLSSVSNPNNLPRTQVRTVTQYMDGLGRPIQTVQKRASPSGKDIVAIQEYNNVGLEAKHYLPYVSSNINGSYKTDPAQNVLDFYNASLVNPLSEGIAKDSRPFGTTSFETSPLHRVDWQLGVGQEWSAAPQPSGNSGSVDLGEVEFTPRIGRIDAYREINTSAHEVRVWTIGYGGTGVKPQHQGIYPAGTLMLENTWDEENNHSRTFTNKQGQVVLKQAWVTLAKGTNEERSTWASTYYVYDDFGLLRYVIPPNAVDQMATSNNWTITNSLRDNLCFYYRYDERKRMVVKKVPGMGNSSDKGEIYMVYDLLDRLVLTQDAKQRSRNEWSFTKYDQLDRPVITGLYNSSKSREELQTEAEKAIYDPFLSKRNPATVSNCPITEG